MIVIAKNMSAFVVCDVDDGYSQEPSGIVKYNIVI